MPLDVEKRIPYIKADGMWKECESPNKTLQNTGVWMKDGKIQIEMPKYNNACPAADDHDASGSHAAAHDETEAGASTTKSASPDKDKSSSSKEAPKIRKDKME